MAMRAVIFDFDGVLVDSEPSHYRALRDALAEEGIRITPEEYASRYLAYDDRECIRIALEHDGQPCEAARVEAAARRKAQIFDALLGHVPFFDGARELVADLARTMPLAIASGALRGEIERIVEAGGLRPSFAAIIGADDVSRCKPHPEPYLTALSRLRQRAPDLRAGECLVIEDSVAGITAGRAAGMRVLGVAHSYPPEKLEAAHHVLPALRGLRAADLQELF
jgi:beta-phosphoglucomutase